MTTKLTSNGSTGWVRLPNLAISATCAVQGDFGGGTATLEWTLDAYQPSPAPAVVTDSGGDVARTSDFVGRIDASGIFIRWTLSGATNPDLLAFIDA